MSKLKASSESSVVRLRAYNQIMSELELDISKCLLLPKSRRPRKQTGTFAILYKIESDPVMQILR